MIFSQENIFICQFNLLEIYLYLHNKKPPRKFLGDFWSIRGWLEFNQYGTQGQFFRWSLPPMVPVSQKESIVPNHKSLYLNRLFASTIFKGSVRDCRLNYPKVATLV